MAEIQAAPGGAVGRIPLGPDGTTYYDDTYVKTKAGWRFKYRQVVTGNETKAGLKAEDFLAIRRLAGDGGKDVGDVWSETPQGWRFRSSGVTIAATRTRGDRPGPPEGWRALRRRLREFAKWLAVSVPDVRARGGAGTRRGDPAGSLGKRR